MLYAKVQEKVEAGELVVWAPIEGVSLHRFAIQDNIFVLIPQ